MKTTLSRRGFLKSAAVAMGGLIFVPSDLIKPRVWLFDKVTDRFEPVQRLGGLQAGSTILSRTISSVQDNRIVLANSHFARPHGVSSAWTKLRVGIRAIMTNSGADVASPDFFMGLCSGTTNIYGDATADHALGIQTKDATMTYNGGVFYNSLMRARKRIGSTNTDVGTINGSTGFVLYTDPTTARRTVMFCDITKGSPNFTLDLFGWLGSGTPDISEADFLTQMEAGSPSLSSHSFNGSAQSVAVDEGTDGTLDAVGLSWNKSSPGIEICSAAVARLS